jgi:hypothetical protein
MEFTLVYRGLLKANGDARDKHAIRRTLHKQLAELWRHPPLSTRADALLADPPVPPKVSLIQSVGSFQFAPLVSSRIGLFAEIAITLLRPHLAWVANRARRRHRQSAQDPTRRVTDAKQCVRNPCWRRTA